MNKIAQALGRMSRGVRKTMTPEALRQRQDAAKASAKARKKNKRNYKPAGREKVAIG